LWRVMGRLLGDGRTGSEAAHGPVRGGQAAPNCGVALGLFPCSAGRPFPRPGLSRADRRRAQGRSRTRASAPREGLSLTAPSAAPGFCAVGTRRAPFASESASRRGPGNTAQAPSGSSWTLTCAVTTCGRKAALRRLQALSVPRHGVVGGQGRAPPRRTGSRAASDWRRGRRPSPPARDRRRSRRCARRWNGSSARRRPPRWVRDPGEAQLLGRPVLQGGEEPLGALSAPCGEQAAMGSIPGCASARPTWVWTRA